MPPLWRCSQNRRLRLLADNGGCDDIGGSATRLSATFEPAEFSNTSLPSSRHRRRPTEGQASDDDDRHASRPEFVLRGQLIESALAPARKQTPPRHRNGDLIFHNIYYAIFACRRPLKMSPACQLQMTLPRGFSGGVWGDGSADERSRVAAARGAAGFGSAKIDGRSGGAVARARAASGVSAVKGLSERRSERPDLKTTRSPQ